MGAYWEGWGLGGLLSRALLSAARFREARKCRNSCWNLFPSYSTVCMLEVSSQIVLFPAACEKKGPNDWELVELGPEVLRDR